MSGVSDFTGIYKRVYANSIEDLVPECALLYKAVPFNAGAEMIGEDYNQAVILTQEQGISYAAPNTDAFTLGGAISMKVQQARVPGYQIAGQATINIEAAMKAVSKGPAAFDNAVGVQMKNLMASTKKRLEFGFLYGQTGVAKAASSANVSTTSTNVTILLAEWSSGFWSGNVNGAFDWYQNGTYGSQTRIGTGSFTVSLINSTTRVVTFTGAAADITALDAYIAANANLAQAFYKSGYNNEAPGLKSQLTKTTAQFNIDPAVYDLWRGNTYTVASPNVLTFEVLQKAIAPAVERGLDVDVDVYINPKAWAKLNADQAALRQYTGVGATNSTTYENGAKKLVFASQNGTVTIHSHIYVKEGDAFIVPLDECTRIGATDATYNYTPGAVSDGAIFTQLAGTMSAEYRLYSNQTFFLRAPAKAVYVTGIVNS